MNVIELATALTIGLIIGFGVGVRAYGGHLPLDWR